MKRDVRCIAVNLIKYADLRRLSSLGSVTSYESLLQRQRHNDLIGWMRKNKRAVRAARTYVEFFDVVCHTTTWKFPKVLTTTWTHNSKSFISSDYFNCACTSPFVSALPTS